MVEVSDAQTSGAKWEGDCQRHLWRDDEVLVYSPREKTNFWEAERRIGGILSCLLLDMKLIFNNNSPEAWIRFISLLNYATVTLQLIPLNVEQIIRVKHSRDFLWNFIPEPHPVKISLSKLDQHLNIFYLLSSAYFSWSNIRGFPLLSPLSVSPYSST